MDDVSFTIAPGEFSVLVGPSGCGKTTALRMIGGLDVPSEGDVILQEPGGDSDLSSGTGRPGLMPVMRTPGMVGYCFQEPRLLPWRTVLENVCLPFELDGTTHATSLERAREMLNTVGLQDASHKRPHELSGGMQMRVAIARALVTQPRLLLLDEPFGALDEITRARLDDELLALWRQVGVTVVMVTHSLAEAVYLGETVHVLSPSPGRLAQTMHIELGKRTAATRLTSEFSDYVARAHRALEVGGSHS